MSHGYTQIRASSSIGTAPNNTPVVLQSVNGQGYPDYENIVVGAYSVEMIALDNDESKRSARLGAAVFDLITPGY